MKLPDIDGEWELREAVGTESRKYVRIQPKEKSLYERVDEIIKGPMHAGVYPEWQIVCQTIEQLEKRVGELEKEPYKLKDNK